MVEPGTLPDPDEPRALTPDAVYVPEVDEEVEPADAEPRVVATAPADPPIDPEATLDASPGADGRAFPARALAVASVATAVLGTVARRGATLARAYPRAAVAVGLSALVLTGVLSMKRGRAPIAEIPAPGRPPVARAEDGKAVDEPREPAEAPPAVAPDENEEEKTAAAIPEPTSPEIPEPAPAALDDVKRAAAIQPSLDLPPEVDLEAEAAPEPSPIGALLAFNDPKPDHEGDAPAPAPAADSPKKDVAPAPAPAPAPAADLPPEVAPAPLDPPAPAPAADSPKKDAAPEPPPAVDLPPEVAPAPLDPPAPAPAADSSKKDAAPEPPPAVELPPKAAPAPLDPPAAELPPVVTPTPAPAPTPAPDATPAPLGGAFDLGTPAPAAAPSPMPATPPAAEPPPVHEPPARAGSGGAEPDDGDWLPLTHVAGSLDLDAADMGVDARSSRGKEFVADLTTPTAPIRAAADVGAAASAGAGAAVAAPARRDEGRKETILHKVRPGENFWTISRTHYASGRYYKALGKANSDQFQRLQDLYVGAVIRIPPPEDLDPTLVDQPGRDRDPDAVERPNVRTAADSPGLRRSRRSPDALELPDSDPEAEQASDRDSRRRAPRDDFAEPAPRRAPAAHRVRSGETLRSIARDRLGDSHRARELLDLNRDVVPDPAHLAPGVVLNLPGDAE